MKKIREKSDGLGGLCSAIHVDAQRSTVVDIELDDATGSIYQIKKYTMRSIFRLVFLIKMKLLTARRSTIGGMAVPFRRAVKVFNRHLQLYVLTVHKSS